MLITEDGEVTGTISGGCLERDVRRHAMWVMQFGRPRRLVYDSTGDDDDDAEDAYSLGCNGVVEVLIERLFPNDSYMALLANCVRASEPVVVVTILETGPGAATCHRLVWRPGKELVTLGMEDDEQLRTLALSAQSVFASGISTMRLLHTGAGPLAVCFEIIEPSPMLAIFGGGQDAIPVAALAKAVGTKVTVVDPRPGQATRTRFPSADRLLAADPQAAVERLGLDGNSLAVVMNHDYRQDLSALGALLPTPVRYLGVLGPKHRTSRLLRDLAARGSVATEAQLARLYSPAGLDIGAETPVEVALAIVAEMKAITAGRRGGSSRERQGTLHERTVPMRDSSPMERRIEFCRAAA